MSSVQDYEVLFSVGSGSFGECQEVRRKSDGKILAWKVVSYEIMTPLHQASLISEVGLLMELYHPNIIRYHEHFVDQEKKNVHIVTDFCVCGDLTNITKYCVSQGLILSEQYLLQVLGQLASALKYCHRRPDGRVLVHQDLKPENVFVDQNRDVKLGDFGLAEFLPSRNRYFQTPSGARLYRCPQKIKKQLYNEKTDIWALGCVMYELCAFQHPFVASGEKSPFSCICRGEFRRIPSYYSEELNSLIRHMLEVQDYMRPSVMDILSNSLLKDMFGGEKEKTHTEYSGQT